ncbi:hypothetical protein B0H67DRAFT_638067 [Lasiosphaeris hirsuta]|uniref:Uncharacterized protein n=1 Tax=Lasiosphaeris hirsuta TaxID=260670 RepID=A0AA40B8C3_9PEZI|nr:hypothetical protein B0H67DRAFT_638067 [Lasiosphaeris hirsuta]
MAGAKRQVAALPLTQTPDLEAGWESSEVTIQDPPDPQQGGVVAAKRGAETKEEVKGEGSAVVGRAWPDAAVEVAKTEVGKTLADGLRWFVISLDVFETANNRLIRLGRQQPVVRKLHKLRAPSRKKDTSLEKVARRIGRVPPLHDHFLQPKGVGKESPMEDLASAAALEGNRKDRHKEERKRRLQ